MFITLRIEETGKDTYVCLPEPKRLHNFVLRSGRMLLDLQSKSGLHWRIITYTYSEMHRGREKGKIIYETTVYDFDNDLSYDLAVFFMQRDCSI